MGKFFGKAQFPRNFHTRELGETTVFYVVDILNCIMFVFLFLFVMSFIIIIIIIIIIELTDSKTLLENIVEIGPQPVALDFKNLSQYSSRSK